MKKLFILLMVLVFIGNAFALPSIAGRPNEKWWSDTTFQNPLWVWLQAADTLIETGAALGTGNVFYVDSNVTTEGNGTSWDTAKDTLDEAVNLCTASNGDVIYVAQGHNEAIAVADAVDIDVIGVTVVGLGVGSLKPTFDYDAATADMFVIGADNVTIQNLRFRVSTNATANAINIPDGIDYAHILGCDFGFAETATDEFADAIQLNDASNFAVISGCYFDAGAQAAQSAIIFSEDTNGTEVSCNTIIGTYAVAPIEGDTTASTNLMINGNIFYTGGTADTFNLVAASTGIVSDNIITMNAVSAAAAMDIGNCLNVKNTLIADDDVGGTKAPPANTATYASVTASADD